jgi:LacI family transcriptional regulator
MAGVTLKTIALQAGVSYAAVSQVLSNPANTRFPAATRKRILAAAHKLNYRPNRFALALKGQATNLFSMVLPWNCPELMDAAERGARDANYQLMVEFTPSPVGGAEAKAIGTALDWHVDGLIWMPYGGAKDYSETIAAIAASSTKVVLLHHGLEDLDGADIVRAETTTSTVAMVTHLSEQGYRQIACLSEQLDFAPDRRRFSLIKSTAAQLGVPCETFVMPPGEFKEKMTAYLRESKMPVAMICNGNWFAVDLIELADALGISSPEQLGIVAIGDFPIGGRLRVGTLTRPRLTAIQEPLGAMAGAAVDLLVSRLQEKIPEVPVERLFSETLVVRDSTMRRVR